MGRRQLCALLSIESILDSSKQGSDVTFIRITKFADKRRIAECKLVEIGSKHGSQKFSGNVAGEQFMNTVNEIIYIVADSSVPYQLSDYSIIVYVSGNHTIRVTESVDLEREGIGFVVYIGSYRSAL